MFQPGDAVLAAVSGGPDSVALLRILLELAPSRFARLAVAHMNHGLRGADSDADADFVRGLAAAHGLPCHVARTDEASIRARYSGSLEEAAREARYAFLRGIAEEEGCDKIATGHQGDDNAEWVLMALIRGSGPRGLSGIPPVREGRFVRPLLGLSRRDITDYLEAIHQPFRTDVTNADPRFLRNRIRRELMPLLHTYNPRMAENLNRLAGLTRDEEDWLGSLATASFEACLIQPGHGRVSLSLSALARLHPAEARRVIREAIARVKGDLRRIGQSHVDGVMRMIRSDSLRQDRHLPDGVRVIATGERLEIGCGPDSESAVPIPVFEKVVTGPGIYDISEIGAQVRFTLLPESAAPEPAEYGQDRAFFDMDRIQFPLVMRNFRPGDRFIPLGMAGSQKVKAFFIDHKVPREARRRCPMVLCGDRIIWLAGLRIDDRVKITAATTRRLQAVISFA